jgi:hypothetical protein
MPITPAAVTGAILAAGPTLKGPKWFALCAAIGTGVVIWSRLPTGVFLTGNTTGTLGGGQVLGKLILPPVPLPVGTVAGAGLVGLSAPQIGAAVGLGIGNSYTASAAYRGPSVGAIGANISKVVLANPATLTPILISQFTGKGFRGPSAAQLAAGLSSGIAAMFLTGFGTGVVAGPTGPAPGTGVSTSLIF